ncbi:spore gernimation protein [Paenibacillus yonginensis]|uniref:Spore gernimation protein n=1 Tax=Paenibacillus yonginensis TaxID=1462996 RepID=A0A1B1N5L0_9BACL|nr:spore gernimation protein [Paenibacillus yonginensis]
MDREKIRLSELLVSLFLFEVGSTTLFFQGGEAKQDAWILMLIAGAAGLLVLLLHLAIHLRDPRLDLFLLFHRYMGPWLGTLINLGFIGYFGYEVSRNLRDLGELTLMTLLPNTKLWLTMVISFLVIANAVRHGPRVNFLMGVLFLPFVAAAYAILLLAVSISGLIHYEFMLPVLEHGFTADMGKSLFEIVSFPFGESIVFLVFYPMIQGRNKMLGKTLFSFAWIAVFLTLINQLNVLVLGPNLVQNSALPLLETVQLIRFPGLFERMDALFTMFLFIGLGVKMAYFFLGGVIGLERITGIGFRKWIIPLGAVIFAASFWSPNYTHHIYIGREVVVLSVWPLFQIALPILLFVVMLLRRKKIKPHG